MKSFILVLINLIIANICYSQVNYTHLEVFNDSIYSKNNYRIIYDSIRFEYCIFEIIKVKPLSNLMETKVFIQRTFCKPPCIERKSMILQETLYSGQSNETNPIYNISPQPMKGKYIIIDGTDKDETVYIIGIKSGNTVRIKGHSLAFSRDSSSIYVKSIDNLTIYKYNSKKNLVLESSSFMNEDLLKFKEAEYYERF